LIAASQLGKPSDRLERLHIISGVAVTKRGQLMIVLTGVSSGLGRAVLDRLLMYVPRERMVATARNRDKLRIVADAGVAVRRADFDDEDSMSSAFADAERLYFIPNHDTG
jgi:NAD(P)H dehydrogenase (quinone)